MNGIETPTGCITNKPTTASILFAGQYINLTTISRAQNIDLSYLSRIFACNRTPTIRYAQRIAAALGMGLEAFLEALEKRKLELEARNKAILDVANDRIKREDEADLRAIKAGKIPIPRISKLRAS